MLQRIQSVFLFLSGILVALMLFFPFIKFNSGQYSFSAFSVSQFENGVFVNVQSTILVGIFIILSSILSFVTIFMFKNRILQMRLTIINIIITICIYASIAFYRLVIFNFDIKTNEHTFWILMPIISIILTFMANRRIKKDEDLVRSVDRIR